MKIKFNEEIFVGCLIIFAAISSLIITNSSFGANYISFWYMDIAHHSLNHWINDGLMTIFFLYIGLELERELYVGELSMAKKAALPLFGALGGMLIPAIIYLCLNYGTSFQSGFGIPMATDIAFAIAIVSLLGKNVPASLKIFLTALAVIDDLGAMFIIAIFYTEEILWQNIAYTSFIYIGLLTLNRWNVRLILPYILGGILMWYLMLTSGVHATVVGFILAFAIPFRDGQETSPSTRLQHILHKPVVYFILPIFAMANTCIPLGSTSIDSLVSSNTLGIFLGLVIGKPLGVTLFALIGVSLGLCAISEDIKWRQIIGIGCLAGMGFTMSIFITLLAFKDLSIVNSSKIAILVSSIVAGAIGYILLTIFGRKIKVAN